MRVQVGRTEGFGSGGGGQGAHCTKEMIMSSSWASVPCRILMMPRLCAHLHCFFSGQSPACNVQGLLCLGTKALLVVAVGASQE